jgi:uncharacterized protein (TIGR02300 family)
VLERAGATREENDVTKAELGVKRRCLACSAAFFDLNRAPIVCPKCATVFQVIELPRSAPRKPYHPMRNEKLVEDQTPNDDEVSAETEAETDETETDDSVPQPIEEDDEIEKIDMLI